MADNLLDKASILLTPTAYNDGSMLSVKRENGDGDFTFSRSSAATRVNAQGLVENVQIISSELVSNGNFSQIGTEEVSNGNFSQEGSELVTNGDFATDSDWTKASNWTISGGSANADGSSGGQLSQTTSPVVVGKTYKIQYTILNYVSGSFRFSYAGTSESFNTSNGTYTTYRVATSTANALASSSISFIGSIDNVSVKEVGQDWTFGTGITIENDKAFFNDSAYPQAIEQTNIATIGKQYKVSFTVSDFQSGNVKLRHPFEVSGVQADGDYVFYGEAASTGITLRGDGVPNNFKIDNISVKEVGQDWTLGTSWSMGENKAIYTTGSATGIQQDIGLIGNRKYKITFNNSGSAVNLYLGTNTSAISAPPGLFEQTLTTASNTNGVFYISNAPGGLSGYIANISVKEITDDTDLPRINYEGFSYQDSLGSEEVVNGTFDSDTSWNKGTGWSIANGKASKESGVSTYLLQSMVLPTPNTYKVTFTVSDYTSGDVKWGFTSTTASIFGTPRTANGTYTEYFTHDSNTIALRFRASSTFQGSIDNVSVKEYLGQEVVPDSGCGSWLMEGQSTNLITYSSDFSQFSNVSDVSITTGFTAPDGTNTASKIVSAGGNAHIAGYNGINTGKRKSIYARTVSGTGKIHLLNTSSDNNSLFDLTDQWQRFDITHSEADFFYAADFRGADVTLSEVLIWGAQLEQQSYATSYIPTNGATNTRNQDIANNSGNSTLINSTEGVLYYEASYIDGSDYNSISISNNSGSEKLRTWYDNTNLVFANFVNNVNQTFIAYPISKNINYKIAVRYKLNDFALYVNGTKATNIVVNLGGVSPQNSYNKLNFNSGDIYNNFYGKNKALAVYKEALTDSNLRSLTYPNPVATTFDLDFDTIAEQFTFTRGSEATFVNAQGLIESTASNDAPRIDYSTGAKAFLLEPQSTNLSAKSQNIGGWSFPVNVTTTQDYGTSPDGSVNSTRLQFTANGFMNDGLTLTNGTEYTLSVYAKRNDTETQSFGFYVNGNPTIVGGITLTDEWQRFTYTYTASSNSSIGLAGNSGADVSVFGFQAEQQSYATSYIPTSGASATRNQELCNNATPVINSEEGTLYAEISSLTELNDDERTISLSDGTNINTVRLQFNKVTNNIRVFVGNGTTQVNNNITISDITDFNKLAFKYKENDFALWINGVEVLTDTSGITFTNGTLTKLGFVRGDNSEYFFGNTKGLKYYPKALADVQLEDLTTI